MPNKYIGVTIGPIYRTMQLTATPAGLWAASYLFSFIARSFCREILDREITCEEDVISPYLEVDGENKLNTNIESVGLFHDRIYFKIAKSKTMDDVIAVVNSVKEKVIQGMKANNFEKQVDTYDIKKFFHEYLQIRVVEEDIEDGENPILVISPYLDALELESSFVQREEINYLLNLLSNPNKNEGQNKHIKASFLVKDTEGNGQAWRLYKGVDKQIKGIDDIARGQQDSVYKRSQYYVLLKADGDNMGKTLEHIIPKINNNKSLEENIKDFSEHCFKYGKKATKKIREYGGVTIYAGGDDLLFIAPVIGKIKGKNAFVFELINEVTEVFEKEFQDYINSEIEIEKPALSWGMTIQYRKYPLYEAFEEVNNLLEKAKEVEEKNTICMTLKKHSGRKLGLKIPQYNSNKQYKIEGENEKENSESKYSVCKILGELIDVKDDEAKFIKSVNTKLMEFKVIIKAALEQDLKTQSLDTVSSIDNVFKNIFDSDIHKVVQNEEYINDIRDLMKQFNKEQKIYLEKDAAQEINTKKGVAIEERREEEIINVIDTIIRISKFLTERRED